MLLPVVADVIHGCVLVQVKVHRASAPLYGTIQCFMLNGDYDGDVFSTGGEVEIAQVRPADRLGGDYWQVGCTHVHNCTVTHTHSHAYAYVLTCSHTHACMLAHTHTHTHTHA